jgi:hypothetical protein
MTFHCDLAFDCLHLEGINRPHAFDSHVGFSMRMIWSPLLEARENASDNLIKFLGGESSRTSAIFGFIASGFGLAPMIIDYAAFDTKSLAEALKWNARRVLLAQNPTCVEALLAEKVAYRKKSSCFGHSMISAQAATAISSWSARVRLPILTNENSKRRHQKESPMTRGRRNPRREINPRTMPISSLQRHIPCQSVAKNENNNCDSKSEDNHICQWDEISDL